MENTELAVRLMTHRMFLTELLLAMPKLRKRLIQKQELAESLFLGSMATDEALDIARQEMRLVLAAAPSRPAAAGPSSSVPT